MCTAHSLTVSPSMLCARGGVPGPGVSGGVGVCPGVYLVWGVSARYTSRDQTRYPPRVDRQTPVNLLPWPNFVAAGNDVDK